MNSISSTSPVQGTSDYTSPVYHDWLTRFKDLFVSHAINAANVEKVLTSGKLLSQEAVLREYGKVECEVSTIGIRGTIDTFNPRLSLKKAFRILYCKQKPENWVEYQIIPNRYLALYTTSEPSKVKTFEKFTVIKSNRAFNLIISNYDTDKYLYEDADYREKSAAEGFIYAVIGSSPDSDYVDAFDHVDELDDTLRAIFQYGIKKKLDYDRLSYALFGIRIRRYTALRANEIRVEKNCVRWAYGRIAILMGNAEAKLAFGKSLLPNRNTVKSEFFLKLPFQTEEGHFSVALNSSDIIILGARAELDLYRADTSITQSIKDRFVNFEELSPEQIQAWEVPQTFLTV